MNIWVHMIQVDNVFIRVKNMIWVLFEFELNLHYARLKHLRKRTHTIDIDL